MALYVNTNVSSINAQRKLSNATLNLNTSYQRLASGMRINSAKDDAAGLQISDRLTSQINGLNQGNRNTNDGIALAQTIEGALDETTSMLQRIRVLAVQSANGTNSASDRAAIQQEVTQLSQEINRIARQTTFAGNTILNGPRDTNNNNAWLQNPNSIIPSKGAANEGKIIFQVGANAGDTLALNWSEPFTMSGLAKMASLGEAKAIGNVKDAKSGIVIDGGDKTQVRWTVSAASLATYTLANIDKVIQAVHALSNFNDLERNYEIFVRYIYIHK